MNPFILLQYISTVTDDQHTSSVTWLALIVMSSTDMSAILLVSKFGAPPVALSSTLWGLKDRNERSRFRGYFHTHTQTKMPKEKAFPWKSTTWNLNWNSIIIIQPHVAQIIYFFGWNSIKESIQLIGYFYKSLKVLPIKMSVLTFVLHNYATWG